MLQAVQVILIFAIPYFINKASKSIKLIHTLSPILLAYVIGIAWGNIKGIPIDRDLSMTISEVTVPLAIPMILFSADFKKWLYSAKKTVVSFVLVVVAALASSLIAVFIFRGRIDEFAKISGMLVGCYTGGTPNLMAIGMSLGITKEKLVLVNASDAILGGAYFLLLISVIKPFFTKILPAYNKKEHALDYHKEEKKVTYNQLDKEHKKKSVFGVISALIFCIAALGLSIGISMLFTGGLDTIIIMLGVTTAGIIGSFIPKVKKIKYTYETGQYIILVFSIALGTSIDIEKLFTTTPLILMYTATVMFGAIIIHTILAKIAKIDADTAIITSTAGIYGPAFVGAVAQALKNREVIIAGMTCGLIGYAVGNYLGFLIYQLALLL